MTHPVNLCPTVEGRVRYETTRCSVWRPKKFPPYFVQEAQYLGLPVDREDAETNYHEWSDHAGGLQGGTCIHCGKTLKECRVRINPKTGEPVRRAGGLARAIANTPADVPPVHFIEVTQ